MVQVGFQALFKDREVPSKPIVIEALRSTSLRRRYMLRAVMRLEVQQMLLVM